MQQQLEIPILPEDGAPHSGITRTVFLSDGLLSLTHSASEEVNQGAQAPQFGMGLNNIALAYQEDPEEAEPIQEARVEEMSAPGPQPLELQGPLLILQDQIAPEAQPQDVDQVSMQVAENVASKNILVVGSSAAVDSAFEGAADSERDNITVKCTESMISRKEVEVAAIKGKQNVMVEPSDVSKKGTFGPHSAPCSPNSFDVQNIVQSHAMDIIDGSHLNCEEGLDLWIQHFAPATQGESNTFKIDIPISWFNFIIHLLLTPDKFGWITKLLKSELWTLLTANCSTEETISFHIPDTCSTSQAPSCKDFMQGSGKENEGISLAAHSSNGTGIPLQQVSPNKILILPLVEVVSRKRKDKEPLVETEVRRSDSIKRDNNGYRRNSCASKTCLPCHALPPTIPNKIVKNLTKSFCKVSEEEAREKLSKKLKKKDKEEVAKVPKATGDAEHPHAVQP